MIINKNKYCAKKTVHRADSDVIFHADGLRYRSLSLCRIGNDLRQFDREVVEVVDLDTVC